MAHQPAQNDAQRLPSASSSINVGPNVNRGIAYNGKDTALTVAHRAPASTADLIASGDANPPKRWTAPLPGTHVIVRKSFFDPSIPPLLNTNVYWIPLGRPTRTQKISMRISIRYTDGREGVPVKAFTSSSRYTYGVHPETKKLVAASMVMDEMILPGERLAYASSPVPKDIYNNVLAIRAAFPIVITETLGTHPCRKDPVQQYTFGHLVTYVVTRQWQWCYNVISGIEGDNLQALQQLTARLRDSLFVIAICKGWDVNKRCWMWFPELELRIPERAVSCPDRESI